MTGRCETCVHWDELLFPNGDRDIERPHGGRGQEAGRWGRCTLVNDGGNYKPPFGPTAERAFTSDASGYSSWLTTRSDFGCVEHAPIADGSAARMNT